MCPCICVLACSHHAEIPTSGLRAETVPGDLPDRHKFHLTEAVCEVLREVIPHTRGIVAAHLKCVLHAPARADELVKTMQKPSRIFLNGYEPSHGMVPHHDTTAWFGAVTVQLLGAEEDGLRVYVHDDDNEGVVLPLPAGCGCVLARHQKHSVDPSRATRRSSLTFFW